MPLEADSRINLTTTTVEMKTIETNGQSKVAVAIVPQTGATWTSAIVELKWSLDGHTFHSFDTPIEFSTGTRARNKISVNGARYLALETTTSESGADDGAQAYFNLYDADDDVLDASSLVTTKIFEAYDSAGGITCTGTTPENLTWDTHESGNSAIYTHDTATNAHQITIGENGRYRIIVRKNLRLVTSASFAGCVGKLLVNGTQIPRGYAEEFVRDATAGRDAAQMIIIAHPNLVAGDVVSVQFHDVSAAEDWETIADGCSILIEQL